MTDTTKDAGSTRLEVSEPSAQSACNDWLSLVRWPRGRYNGRKIVGFMLKFEFDVLCWFLAASWNFGEPYLIIDPLYFRCSLVYRR